MEAGGDPIERLVVVGCSWGGLAAVSTVLDHLPSDSGVAVVVAQHRSPAPSTLGQLLAGHTGWPVGEAQDKDPVRPRTVVVAPGGYHLLVDGEHYALTTEAPVRHSRPSIDVLFESAADAYTDRVVAVVLTGANADGAAGVRRVVHRGGVAIVQDPSTAARREMPDAAIATGVDVRVARVEDIGPLVGALVRGEGDVTARAPVLVVDDRPANLLAVEAVLEPLDLDVVRAGSGEEALRMLLHQGFAVILLDVQMPDLDGFATARLIKARAKTRSIPIIFLTALDRDLDDELEGYGSGAVDYLTKPFDPAVLRAKVAVFVELHRKAALIEEQRVELAANLQDRDASQRALQAQAAELARSNAELERFASVAAHQLQEPLDVIAGLVEVAVGRLPSGVAPEPVLALDEAASGLREVRAQLDALLAYAEVGTAALRVAPVDLGALVDEVLADDALGLEEVGATVTVDPLPVVAADRWLLGLVLSNLLDNAVRFRAERPLEVHIGLARTGGSWVVAVADNGRGIPSEDLPTLFTSFGAGGGSTGASLSLCRRIVERHGGTIDVDSLPDVGTTISLRLPVGGDDPVPEHV